MVHVAWYPAQQKHGKRVTYPQGGSLAMGAKWGQKRQKGGGQESSRIEDKDRTREAVKEDEKELLKEWENRREQQCRSNRKENFNR